jgi:hypothetical protein
MHLGAGQEQVLFIYFIFCFINFLILYLLFLKFLTTNFILFFITSSFFFNLRIIRFNFIITLIASCSFHIKCTRLSVKSINYSPQEIAQLAGTTRNKAEITNSNPPSCANTSPKKKKKSINYSSSYFTFKHI